jgi:hypothetical protein
MKPRLLSWKSKSVDEIIDSLPKDEKAIVERLRFLIKDSLPTATEKNSYGVPFYSHHRTICFIWPPSIYWGKKKYTLKEYGVTLGFCQGNRMLNEDRLLLAEKRKQVLCIYYRSVKELDEKSICSWLFEADMIDEGFAKRKARSKWL